MNTILMAAARGARIESEYHNWSNGGTDWRSLDMPNTVCARIHPDDEHLRFGPISTALRERAGTGHIEDANIPYIEGRFKDFTDEEWGQFIDGGYHERSLFLLILSEALAEEGL